MNAVVTVVVPVFGTVGVGYALARAGLFDRDTGAGLVRFMYYLAIPALLFRSLATARLPPSVPWHFLAAFYGPVILTFLLARIGAVGALGWSAREGGIAGMSASYANMVMLGYPLVLTAFGTDGTVPLFILLATQSTVMFPLATWTIEAGGSGARRNLALQVRALLRLLLNPVIPSLALGVTANLLGWRPAGPVAGVLDLLAAAGPGCALVALGITLAQYRVGGSYRAVLWLVALKNLLCPALVWLACVPLGIDGLWREVAVLLAAMPAGINAFIFASQYGLRQEEVAKAIVVSTLLSAAVSSALLARFLG